MAGPETPDPVVRGRAGEPDPRREQLAAALERVKERLAVACAAAGRSPSEVALLAVTKTRPAADVALLLDLGLGQFGENRPQEAAVKVGELSRLRPDAEPRWHLVGRLQRNKARSVVLWAHRVESVDSARLVDTLGSEVVRAQDMGLRHRGDGGTGGNGGLPVLLQISLDGDPERAGVPVAEAQALADRIVGTPGLDLHGVMAVAPLGQDADRAFASLAGVAGRIRADHPGAVVVSAGMSGDLEAAIRNGSTCVRVGTALLGDRRLTSP